MNSSDQVARLLALVPYLQAHPDADVRTTASVFGVSPRQLIADLNVLWYCGLPGGMPGDLIEVDMDAVESEGRIRLTNADYLARPLRFTLDEAMSLAVALRSLQELGDDLVLLSAAAEAGIGIGALPTLVCHEAMAAGRLVALLPEYQLPGGILHAVFPSRRGLVPAVRAFIDFLVEELVPPNHPAYDRL